MECLGRPHAGDAGFNGGVDLCCLGLQLQIGPAHFPPLINGEEKKERDNGKREYSQLPLNGTHDTKRTHQSDSGNKEVFRPMVGQFCDFKQIIGDPRHEDPGAVFIKEAEAQALHVGIQVPSKIGLYPDAKDVPPIGDNKVQ